MPLLPEHFPLFFGKRAIPSGMTNQPTVAAYFRMVSPARLARCEFDLISWITSVLALLGWTAAFHAPKLARLAILVRTSVVCAP